MSAPSCGCSCRCPVRITAPDSLLKGVCTFCREGRHDRIGMARRELLRLVHNASVTTLSRGSESSGSVDSSRHWSEGTGSGSLLTAAAAHVPRFTERGPG